MPIKQRRPRVPTRIEGEHESTKVEASEFKKGEHLFVRVPVSQGYEFKSAYCGRVTNTKRNPRVIFATRAEKGYDVHAVLLDFMNVQRANGISCYMPRWGHTRHVERGAIYEHLNREFNRL